MLAAFKDMGKGAWGLFKKEKQIRESSEYDNIIYLDESVIFDNITI